MRELVYHFPMSVKKMQNEALPYAETLTVVISLEQQGNNYSIRPTL